MAVHDNTKPDIEFINNHSKAFYGIHNGHVQRQKQRILPTNMKNGNSLFSNAAKTQFASCLQWSLDDITFSIFLLNLH